MAHYTYKTKMTCSSAIDFEIDGDRISDVVFTRGCNGNLKAIAKLVDGMTVDEIERVLKGNTCGMRPTSCADQLAKAVRKAYEAGQNGSAGADMQKEQEAERVAHGV